MAARRLPVPPPGPLIEACLSGANDNVRAYVGADPINASDPSGMIMASSCAGDDRGGVSASCSGGNALAAADAYRQSVTWANAYLTSVVAQGSSGGQSQSSLSSTLRALLTDEDVRYQMAVAWVRSGGDGSTAGKNEYGFWISQTGSDFVAHRMIRGYGPFIYDARREYVQGASIFFHTHPFYVGEIRNIESLGLTYGDMSIARDYRSLVFSIARPGRGIRGTFSVSEFDCRSGC